MQLCDAADLCRNRKLTGWDMVAYVNHLVSKSMQYSVEIPLASHKKAFQMGKGYCVQQAFCVRDLLQALGFQVQVVYCRKAFFKNTNTMSGHTWCSVLIGDKAMDVCTCNSENSPGNTHFTAISKVKPYRGFIVAAGYLGSIPVCLQRLLRSH